MAILTKDDISHIYNKHVVANNNPEYLNRYIPLPMERKNRWWEGGDFPRIIAILEFERLVQKYTIEPEKLLILNGYGNEPEVQYVEAGYTLEIDYNPSTGENDLHTLDLPEKDFDLVLLGQTLEHLYNPVLALERLFMHVSPGGYLFASVPVINIPHTTPFCHYTGFTPTGLGAVCKVAGFDIIHIGQWGNVEYINLLFSNRWWPDYHLLGDKPNDFETPCSTWILAQRPGY